LDIEEKNTTISDKGGWMKAELLNTDYSLVKSTLLYTN
jgi:hypothetical protein